MAPGETIRYDIDPGHPLRLIGQKDGCDATWTAVDATSVVSGTPDHHSGYWDITYPTDPSCYPLSLWCQYHGYMAGEDRISAAVLPSPPPPSTPPDTPPPAIPAPPAPPLRTDCSPAETSAHAGFSSSDCEAWRDREALGVYSDSMNGSTDLGFCCDRWAKGQRRLRAMSMSLVTMYSSPSLLPVLLRAVDAARGAAAVASAAVAAAGAATFYAALAAAADAAAAARPRASPLERRPSRRRRRTRRRRARRP